MLEEHDPTRFRVTMLCPCQVDYVQAFGATAEAALEEARRFWRRNHAGQKPTDIIVDVTVPHDGGSHYELHEEVTP